VIAHGSINIAFIENENSPQQSALYQKEVDSEDLAVAKQDSGNKAVRS
jgi:hypothetical protein